MTEAEIRSALAREDLCRLLAACYYEPEPAFEEEGMFAALHAAARLVDDALVPQAQALSDAFRATDTRDLLLDYARLFLGPMEILAKPYGSVWLDAEKTLMGDSTLAVLELYRAADFDMDDEFKDLPDHIAVELEFLYQLIFRENASRQDGDTAKLAATLDLQRRFLTQHLGAWTGRFTSALQAGAQCDFYRTLAGLTDKFVGQQLARFDTTVTPSAPRSSPA